jgi:hypothetical protein
MAAIKFKYERDLCAAFMKQAREKGWRCYPEFFCYDIYLAKDDIHIGIEAKLQANLEVVSQCIGRPAMTSGPDFRAVLVPSYKTSYKFSNVCEAAGIVTFTEMTDPVYATNLNCISVFPVSHPELPLVEDVEAKAGCAAPLRMTQWKINMLRLLAISEIAGYVTNLDFKRCRVNKAYPTSPNMGWFVRGVTKGHWMEKPGGVACNSFRESNRALYDATLEKERKARHCEKGLPNDSTEQPKQIFKPG